MPDINGILNIGKSALLSYQQGMNVISNNISNVNTPGYSRQTVNLSTNESLSCLNGQFGTGVNVFQVQRVYDQYLSDHINTENQSLGKWEAQKGTLGRTEIIFDESSEDGLNTAMGEFWNAWQDLVNNPSGYPERTNLLAKSKNMTDKFNTIYADLKQVQKDTDSTIKASISEINRLTGQIADLNSNILQAEVDGQSANEMRDQRDSSLKELSALIDFTSFENDNGNVTVLLKSGQPLVENVASFELSSSTNGSGYQDIFWTNPNGTSHDITPDISGGKLKGLLNVRDVDIPDYLNRLNTLASNIINDVNAIHNSGYALDGSQNNFFTGGAAGDININTAIENNVNLIAAAGSSDGLPGGNSNAIDIANLQNQLKMSGNTATYDDYYQSLVSDVGSSVENSNRNFDHQTAVTTQLENYRETTSGVSLDEEMVNLVKFQHAYAAAAKLVTTADELMQSLLNMV